MSDHEQEVQEQATRKLGWTQTEECQNEISEMIEAWDRGESVWSVEMGGIGPGYEQAIQTLAIELLREFTSNIPDTHGEWDSRVDAVVRRIDEGCCGFTGAQVGAATNIASVFLRQGHKRGLEMADADRHILISKDWPRCPVESSASEPAERD